MAKMQRWFWRLQPFLISGAMWYCKYCPGLEWWFPYCSWGAQYTAV